MEARWGVPTTNLRLVPRPVIVTARQTIPTLLGSKTVSSARDERSPGARRRSQPTVPSLEHREQRPAHRYLGQLERDDLRVMQDLRADLDQILLWRRQRPSLYRPWQRQLTQEVAQVLGRGKRRGRTWLSWNRRHDNRVHFRAFLSSLVVSVRWRGDGRWSAPSRSMPSMRGHTPCWLIAVAAR